MKIDIYTSTKNGNKYLSVPEGTNIEKLKLPDTVDPDILSVSPFKSSLKLDSNKPRIALDQNDVIKQIKEHGYALHGAKIEITISTTSKK
jgi:uncharacterized protein YcgL (UPF0745 family)